MSLPWILAVAAVCGASGLFLVATDDRQESVRKAAWGHPVHILVTLVLVIAWAMIGPGGAP